MNSISKIDRGGVALMPSSPCHLVDGLAELVESVACVCPPDSVISLRYDGRLHIDIDVRGAERALLVESFLPTLNAGSFSDIRRGKSPSPFLQRITAEVYC